MASDGVWDALSIQEIQECFNTFSDENNIRKETPTDDKSAKSNSDKVIPTNVSTFDNIHYNNKGNRNKILNGTVLMIIIIILDLFHDKLNSICDAIVQKSVNSEFWKQASILIL